MFMCRVLLCFGLSCGYGPAGARASARPSVQDNAVDYSEFHHRHQTEKTEPRQPAASPIAIIKFVADYVKLLIGDPTDARTTRASFFPPGSRAAVPGTPIHNISDGSVNGRQLADVDITSTGGSLPAETSTWWQILSRVTSPWIWGSVVTVTIVGALCTMMPGQGGASREQNFNYRIPPAWSPDMDHHYSFRAYMTDISLWVILTDSAPYQQCAAIVMRLGGPAREFARMISPQEIMTGGWHD